MKNLKFISASLIAAIFYTITWAQADVDQLIKAFNSEDWKTVRTAKESLENLEEKAVPMVIQILDKDEDVKLQNTGSLIYQGAEHFYGHGQIVEYAINNLSIRAGWLIEDLSFNNFGFSGYGIHNEELMGFIRITFPEFYNNANNRKMLESSSFIELRTLIHKLSVKKAKDWWENEADKWTRLESLVEALQSFDEKRQVKALFYLRNGTTSCKGLTKDYYIDNISREIVRLGSSDTKRVSEHARLILINTKLTWLDNKIQ
ncbi:hypothetical protein ES705_23989 [subsurface metagenome]